MVPFEDSLLGRCSGRDAFQPARFRTIIPNFRRRSANTRYGDDAKVLLETSCDESVARRSSYKSMATYMDSIGASERITGRSLAGETILADIQGSF